MQTVAGASPAFVPATKKQRKARVAMIGPSGSGKSLSSLLIASGMGDHGSRPRIAAIDTEHGSLSLYSDRVPFDVLALRAPYSTARYLAALEAAVAGGYDVVIVDSQSHEWSGQGGILESVDAAKARGGNGFAAWNGPSQDHESYVQRLVGLPVHIIATFRSKQEYLVVQERGQTEIRKVGLAAITRDNVEYEFDLVIEIDLQHRGVITKSRLAEFQDKVIPFPGANLGQSIATWLAAGAPDQTAERTPDPLDRGDELSRGLTGADKQRIVTLATRLSRSDRDAFYTELLDSLGYKGNGFAGVWTAFERGATVEHVATALAWLAERETKAAPAETKPATNGTPTPDPETVGAESETAMVSREPDVTEVAVLVDGKIVGREVITEPVAERKRR